MANTSKGKGSKKKTTTKKVETKNNNKVIILIIALIIFFIGVFAISDSSSKGKYTKGKNVTGTTTSGNDVETESANIKEDEMGELKEIGIDEYLDIKEGDEYAVIYIGRPTCSHCSVQKPIMQYMVYKYDMEINYLNTDELDEDGFNELQKSDDYFAEGWGTPLVLIVKDNEIVDKSEGETSIEDLTTLFKKYNLISE